MDAFVICDYNGLSSAPAHGLFTFDSRRSALAFEAESVTSFFFCGGQQHFLQQNNKQRRPGPVDVNRLVEKAATVDVFEVFRPV